MTYSERVIAAINHQEQDRILLDTRDGESITILAEGYKMNREHLRNIP